MITGAICSLFATLLALPARGGLSLDFNIFMADSDDDARYTLYLDTETGTNQAASWSGGVTGSIRQFWLDSELPMLALSAATLLAPDPQPKDSHFLVSDVNLHPGEAFSETASNMMPMRGSLTGAFSLLFETTATRLSLVRVSTSYQ